MHFGVLVRVFSHPRYAFFMAMVAFIVLSAAILLPQYAIIKQIFLSDMFTFAEAWSFVLRVYLSLGASMSVLSGTLLVLMSLVFAIDVALMTYYIRRRQLVLRDRKAKLVGVGGTVSSLLGIGCAACGSVILSGVIGLFGGASFLALLPLHGAEFGVLGLVLLLGVAGYLLRRIDDPLVCPIEAHDPRP